MSAECIHLYRPLPSSPPVGRPPEAAHASNMGRRVDAAVPYVYNARAEDHAAVSRWLQSLDLVRACAACSTKLQGGMMLMFGRRSSLQHVSRLTIGKAKLRCGVLMVFLRSSRAVNQSQNIAVEAQVADADLGERMRAALQAALDAGHRKVSCLLPAFAV